VFRISFIRCGKRGKGGKSGGEEAEGVGLLMREVVEN
jgi:hypothetical protein